MNQARLPFTFTSSIRHSLVVIEFQQSSSPCCLLCCFYWGVVIGALWVAYTVLCWSPSSCQGGWSPPWGAGPGDTGLFQAVSRSPCPLVLPGLAAYSRHPLSVAHASVLTRKLPAGSSSIPRQSSVRYGCSVTERWQNIPSSHLPYLSFLRNLYPSIALPQTCQLLYLVSMIPARSQTASAHRPFNSSNSLNSSFECFEVKKSYRDPIMVCPENKAAPLIYLVVGYLWWLKNPPKCINFQIGLPRKADVRLQLLFLSCENQLMWLMLDFKACVMFMGGESSCF